MSKQQMSDIFDDLEDFWYDVDRRWEQKDDFLSRVEDFDCQGPVCSISDNEKNWAMEQMDRWLQRFT